MGETSLRQIMANSQLTPNDPMFENPYQSPSEDQFLRPDRAADLPLEVITPDEIIGHEIHRYFRRAWKAQVDHNPVARFDRTFQCHLIEVRKKQHKGFFGERTLPEFEMEFVVLEHNREVMRSRQTASVKSPDENAGGKMGETTINPYVSSNCRQLVESFVLELATIEGAPDVTCQQLQKAIRTAKGKAVEQYGTSGACAGAVGMFIFSILNAVPIDPIKAALLVGMPCGAIIGYAYGRWQTRWQ